MPLRDSLHRALGAALAGAVVLAATSALGACSVVSPQPLWELAKGVGAAVSVTVSEQPASSRLTVRYDVPDFDRVCIEYNPHAEVEDIVPVLQLELRSHRIESRVYDARQRVASCRVWLRYRASIAWDTPPMSADYKAYVSDAALTLQTDAGRVISTSQYAVEPGLVTSKWLGTRAKLAPVVTALLTGAEVGPPPVCPDSSIRITQGTSHDNDPCTP